MFIEVIPLDSSIDASWLTYFVADHGDFSIGSLVEIPLRDSLSWGIIARVDTPPPSQENIRSIVSITCGMPLIAEYELQIIFYLANRHFVHAHKVLSLFLSRSLVRYLEKKSFIQLKTPWTVKSCAQKKPRLIHVSDSADFLDLVNRQLQDREKICVIFPDDFSIDAYIRRFGENEETIIVRDEITETQKYKKFIEVYNWEKKILIWTRRLLYYNLSHYRRVLYIEDSLRKNTLTFQHSYNNLEILELIAERGGIETTIFSTIPSIESLYKAHTKIYDFETI